MKIIDRIFLIILLSCVHKNFASLPSSIHACSHVSKNKLADCVKHAIELLRPQIATGILSPELVFDEKLNPLNIGDVEANRNFILKLYGTKLFGIQNFAIDKLRINADNFRLDMIINIPKIEGTAKYSLNWAISLFNLQGSGNHNFHMENTKAQIKIIGSKYFKHGIQFLKIDRCDVRIKSGMLKVYFENLFKGNNAMNEAANDVINQNIDVIINDVYPIFERELGKKLYKISNQIFAIAPFNEFFPNH